MSLTKYLKLKIPYVTHNSTRIAMQINLRWQNIVVNANKRYKQEVRRLLESAVTQCVYYDNNNVTSRTSYRTRVESKWVTCVDFYYTRRQKWRRRSVGGNWSHVFNTIYMRVQVYGWHRCTIYKFIIYRCILCIFARSASCISLLRRHRRHTPLMPI